MGLDFRMRSSAFPSSFSSPLFCWFSKEIANLRCRQGRALLEVSVVTVRTHQNSPFYSDSASFPLVPARESHSDGLIPCTNATFIMACSIFCFQYIGSVFTPWPLWNIFAVNGCLDMGRCTVRFQGKPRPTLSQDTGLGNHIVPVYFVSVWLWALWTVSHLEAWC